MSGKYFYLGPSHWAGQEPGDQKPENKDEAVSKIDALHDSGIPFFTKERIQHVHDQLKKSLKRGDKISVQGVDGVTVNFDVVTGKKRKDHENGDMEFVVKEPCISYTSYQSLKSRLEYTSRFYLACCSLTICHLMIKRNKTTKEPVLPPSMSPEELNSHFERSISAWKASETCKHLKATLRSAKISHDIQKVIGFACGSVAVYDKRRTCSRSAFQHALLLTVTDVLQEKNGNSIACYAQDPANTAADKTALKCLGIQVLDDPCGFLEVDDSAVVCSFAPNVPVKQIVTDLARPAVLIWDRVREGPEGEKIGGHTIADADSSRIREIIGTWYDQFEFPDDKNFPRLGIYIRRESPSSPGKWLRY